jgi:ribosomal protein L30
MAKQSKPPPAARQAGQEPPRAAARHKACVSGLGLRRMHHSVVVADTPENRGMINKVSYLLQVEEV